MRRACRICLVLVVLALAACAQQTYVASSVREPFHRPTCKWAAKISSEHLRVFKTRQEAIDAGHRPCKVCKP